MSDPDKPSISSTLWRSVIDHDAKRYYFDSVINPSVVWVDLGKVDLKPGAKLMKLKLGVPDNVAAMSLRSSSRPRPSSSSHLERTGHKANDLARVGSRIQLSIDLQRERSERIRTPTNHET